MTLSTPAQIDCFRLATMKQRIKLESVGLKSSGASTRTIMAAELGLSSRAPHKTFIDAIQVKMDQKMQAIQAGA